MPHKSYSAVCGVQRVQTAESTKVDASFRRAAPSCAPREPAAGPRESHSRECTDVVLCLETRETREWGGVRGSKLKQKTHTYGNIQHVREKNMTGLASHTPIVLMRAQRCCCLARVCDVCVACVCVFGGGRGWGGFSHSSLSVPVRINPSTRRRWTRPPRV